MALRKINRPQQEQNQNQGSLFEAPAVQEARSEEAEPYASFYIHFEKQEDMEEFTRVFNQTVNKTIREVNFPPRKIQL